MLLKSCLALILGQFYIYMNSVKKFLTEKKIKDEIRVRKQIKVLLSSI